ncbi:MAG: nucleotidyl transferase AbiEii/AbiGii toxin family protein [Anaerolineales bacterium]
MSRDLFDVYQLLKNGGFDLHEVRNLMKAEFEVRGLSLAALDPSRFVMRKAEFQRDWNRNLQHLLPYSEKNDFEKAWTISVESVDWVASLE